MEPKWQKQEGIEYDDMSSKTWTWTLMTFDDMDFMLDPGPGYPNKSSQAKNARTQLSNESNAYPFFCIGKSMKP